VKIRTPSFLLVVLAFSTAVACSNRRVARTTAGPGGDANAPPASARLDTATLAQAFSGADSESILTQLADPSMQGRHVGTAGELKGASLIASRFADDGLQPAGDAGGYLQAFPMTIEEQASIPTLELTGPDGTLRSLHIRDDYRPIFGGLAGQGDVTGPGLFVPPDADLDGLPVSGKVLFVLGRGSVRDILSRARDAGAVAVILPTGEQPILKSEGSAPDTGAVPVAEVSQTGAAALLNGSGHTREELNAAAQSGQSLKPFPLQWTVHYRVSLKSPEHTDAHNVLAVLPGTSNDRFVVVGAHFEEIGPDPDGVVYPAANDNASGVAVMLELADALHRLHMQPGATIVFAAWSGHEEGLFGSRYYVDHPARPTSQTQLYLNLDTVGQGSGKTVDVFSSDGSASALSDKAVADLRADELSNLSDAFHGIAKPAGDSDDISFSRAGIPNVALSWTGLFDATKIHTPDDTAVSVDPHKLATTGGVAAALLVAAAR
jgi:Peptidase family M28